MKTLRKLLEAFKELASNVLNPDADKNYRLIPLPAKTSEKKFPHSNQ